MSTATASLSAIAPIDVAEDEVARRRTPLGRIAAHVFLFVIAVLWLVPLVWAMYTSLRPNAETLRKGYVSLPDKLTFNNYTQAWRQGQIPHFLINTLFIAIPGVFITLFLSSMVAYVVTRFSWRFNVALLVLFTSGNLLPQQVIILPLFHMFKRMWLPWFLSDSGHFLNSAFGLIAIHVAFQTGFCTFVLSNYMKTIPKELGEAAMVDGASVPKQFFRVILPLCRPALAALATLEFTWIYNDFFWAVVLVNQGNDRPITSSIANLTGQFFSDSNLVAAGSLLIALPTLIVYLILQKQFIGGLTLGANKG